MDKYGDEHDDLSDEEPEDFSIQYVNAEDKNLEDKNAKKNVKIIYQGKEFYYDMGTLIRKLDREQAQINEQKRRAFFNTRKKELKKQFKKAIEKQIEEGHKEEDVMKHYNEII